jgi:Ca-activated chloride channel family protein
LLEQVSGLRRQGVNFFSIGFGLGNYNDEILEALANKGDGNYLFVASKAEAREALVEQMSATIQYIAKDAKIQVEFNPQRVRRYRLIGYENRDIADKDFRNDAIDAGEVGSGQSATALYEVELMPETGEFAPPDLGTVHVRYRDLASDEVEAISVRLANGILRPRTPQYSPRFFLAACVAEFAELLRGSEHARDGSYADLRHVLEQVVVELPLDNKARELLSLVRQAQRLAGGK